MAIIGAGPIGLELAVALKHAGVTCAQVEAGAIGSTFMWWSPGTRFFSSPERIEIAGAPLTTVHQEKATREEYLAYLRGVVQQFELAVQTHRRVASLERAGDAFQLQARPSEHGVGGPEESRERPGSPRPAEAIRARNVVLAIGDMHRPRLLGVPGEDLPHVSHYFGEPHRYFGRRVLIVGGKNSAVEAALRLHRLGVQVAISYRGREFDAKRVKYWLRPELEWLIERQRIGFYPCTMVKAIHADRVELAPVEGNGGAAAREVAADAVLALTGYVQDSTLMEQLGVTLKGDERAPSHDLDTMQTNVAGVYVAGTAAAGSQSRARLFIENSHVHVRRITRSIAEVDPPWPASRDFGALEQ